METVTSLLGTQLVQFLPDQNGWRINGFTSTDKNSDALAPCVGMLKFSEMYFVDTGNKFDVKITPK